MLSDNSIVENNLIYVNYIIEYPQSPRTLKKGGVTLIYENIKEVCDKKNISISALEKRAGIGNGTIGKWKESKSGPTVETLLKIADVLGVSIGRLVK